MADLLTAADLPDDFAYPGEFVRTVELGITSLEPWWILQGELLQRRLAGLRDRFPGRVLIPFAVRQDNDDVACFVPGTRSVAVIHDFAKPGWEDVANFDHFHSWLRKAVEDFIEFGEMEFG